MSATAYAREADLWDRDKARCPVAASAQELVQEALTKPLPDPVRVRLEGYVIDLGAMVERGHELTEDSARELTAYIAEHADGLCVRWGAGADKCIKPFDHCGPCEDARGNTTLTLAAEMLGQ